MAQPRLKRGQKGVDMIVWLSGAFVVIILVGILGPVHYMVSHETVDKGSHFSGESISEELPIRTKDQIHRNSPVGVLDQDTFSKEIEQQQEQQLKDEVIVEELDNEKFFIDTIKSCLPGQEKPKQKCRQYVPDPMPGESKRVQRVAILAPPGEISSSLLSKVEEIAHHHNKRHDREEPEIEVFERTHVPPYGYGKTHGLTKVLRLVPQPLLLEVTDALHSVLAHGETAASLSLNDIKAALRQIIRFHCRISHLSAHTALYSVDLEELMLEPDKIKKKLQKFLIPKDLQESVEADDEVEYAPDDDQSTMFEALELIGTQLLSRIQEDVDIKRVLDQVLVDELKNSKNLSVWPCPSFWSAGEPDDPNQLSPIVQRLARALSPDCNDAYGQCWVQRDKCEASADGPCKGK